MNSGNKISFCNIPTIMRTMIIQLQKMQKNIKNEKKKEEKKQTKKYIQKKSIKSSLFSLSSTLTQ